MFYWFAKTFVVAPATNAAALAGDELAKTGSGAIACLLVSRSATSSADLAKPAG